MKKIITILMMIIGVSTYSNSAFGTVIAQVKLEDTELLKLNEVEKKIELVEKQYNRELSAVEKDKFLDSLIDNILVLQAAKRDGLEITEKQIMEQFRASNPGATDEQIKEMAEQQYQQSWDKVSKALIDTYTVQQYIQYKGAEDLKAANVQPTEQEIVNFYQQNSDSFVNPDLVRVDHVFFVPADQTPEADKAAKKKADDALVLFKQGKKTFNDLVQEFSEDQNSVRNGGELGFITRNNPTHIKLLGKEFIDQVFSLPMDEVHGVIKSASGYHIIKITEKRSKRFLKISDQIEPGTPATVAQFIQQKLYQEKANRAMAVITQKIVDELRAEAVIKKMDKLIPWK